MKLLHSTKELESEFLRLLKQYKAFYWTTAWAGVNSSVYKELCNRESKIQQIIVGTHFYQTHPLFIQRFLNNSKVKFIKQPEGTFHPKLYLFYDSDSHWELIVGSANFTKEAFSKNTEAVFLASADDDSSNEVLKQSIKLINASWKKAQYFDVSELERYKTIWNIQKNKLKALSGNFGNTPYKPIHDIEFMVLTWAEFARKVILEPNNSLKNRLRVLEIAKSLFEKKERFSDFTEAERKFIAGTYNNFDVAGAEHWGYFGSMIGAGKFKNKINSNNPYISKALDEIPLYGQITEAHYNNFIKHFSIALPGNYIATSTRLLAMKRPDIFYCLTSANKRAFCKGFNIVYSNINYETYWEQVVLKVINSEWWINPNPTNANESKISMARAAFLDAFCYEGKYEF